MVPEVFSNILAYHGETFRVGLFQAMIKGLACLLPAHCTCPVQLAHMLAALPEDMVLPGGSLHESIIAWIAAGEGMDGWLQTGITTTMKDLDSSDDDTVVSNLGSSGISVSQSTCVTCTTHC